MGIAAAALRSIGLRAGPKKIEFAVVAAVSADRAELLTVSSIPVPAALELPEQLSFVRTTILDVMTEYEVRRAGIRIAEYTAQQISIPRINLEGVVQELLSASDVEAYFAGPIARIAALLGEQDRSRVKEYFDGATFMDFPDWAALSVEGREAVVTAVAALSLRSVK